MAPVYNGQSITLRDRVRSFLNVKMGQDSPFIVAADYQMPAARWSPRNAHAYFREGYKLNSAVFACTRALANGFAEAPLLVYQDETKKKPIPDHPLRTLIKRPNQYMGEDEWWKYIITYAPTGGNAYGKIVPNNAGTPAELWPYHDMVMWPMPDKKRWIAYYAYSVDNGRTVEQIPVEEILHFKWAIDPDQPWKGLSALASVSREVDTDNELTRYLKALLQNDSVPRGVLQIPEGAFVTPDQKREMKDDWRLKTGAGNRGDVTVLSGGVEYKRISLDMQELAFDALRGVPEARIAAAYGVPAIVAGLNIGLVRSTYSNFEEARKMFTEQVLIPLWKAVAGEVQQSLVPFFGNDVYVDFDLTNVRALQEGQNDRAARLYTAMSAGAIKVNEYRVQGLGMDKTPGGDVYQLPKGDNGYSLTKDLRVYTAQSDTLAEHAVMQSQTATESGVIQNEAAQAQLAQTAQAAPAPAEGEQPDNVITLDEGAKSLQLKDAPKTGPGARGGKFYIDKNGKVRYGTPPHAKPAKPAKAATTEAERARKAAVKLAKGNAQNEIADANGDIASLIKGGWEHDDEEGLGKAYKTAADANEWAREVGAAPDRKDRIVAVVKGSDGGYYVVSKPQSKLSMPDNGNTVTRNVAQDAAQTERDKVQADRQAAADASRAQRQADTETRRQERQARADARTAAREARQAAREQRLSANEGAASLRDSARRAQGTGAKPKATTRRVKPGGS